MSQSNDFPHDPFEEHVADLLSRTARVARPNPALSQLVRQRLVSDYGSRSRRRPVARFWPMVTQFGAFAVATLVVAAVGVLLLNPGGKGPRQTIGAGTTPTANATATATVVTSPTHPPSCGDDSAMNGTASTSTISPPDHSAPINKSATSSGVTITLDRAYADATQTVILFHMTGGSAQASYSSSGIVLVDASGKQYKGSMGGAVNEQGYSNAKYMAYLPMPQNELSSPHRLTFSVSKLIDSNSGISPNGTPNPPIQIPGSWQIAFTLTPVAGTTIPVTLPAQTHDGVTIKVESVDIAPAGGGINGQNGGARVHVRVSGLPAGMTLTDVASYTTYMPGPNGSGGGSFMGMLPGDMGCPELDLRYFPGLPLLPGAIEVNGQDLVSLSGSADPTTWPRVGPSGSAEMDVLFYGPFTDGKMVLTFDGIRISTPESGRLASGLPADLRVAHGPWVFSIPLQQP